MRSFPKRSVQQVFHDYLIVFGCFLLVGFVKIQHMPRVLFVLRELSSKLPLFVSAYFDGSNIVRTRFDVGSASRNRIPTINHFDFFINLFNNHVERLHG